MWEEIREIRVRDLKINRKGINNTISKATLIILEIPKLDSLKWASLTPRGYLKYDLEGD